MTQPQPFRYQPILSDDQVIVVVMRKLGPQPVRGFGRFAVTNGVRQDDEIPARVERLAWAEQLTCEDG